MAEKRTEIYQSPVNNPEAAEENKNERMSDERERTTRS